MQTPVRFLLLSMICLCCAPAFAQTEIVLNDFNDYFAHSSAPNAASPSQASAVFTREITTETPPQNTTISLTPVDFCLKNTAYSMVCQSFDTTLFGTTPALNAFYLDYGMALWEIPARLTCEYTPWTLDRIRPTATCGARYRLE